MQDETRFSEFTEADLEAAIRLRHDLHRLPEISGEETATAASMAYEMRELGADEIITDIGGHGVVAVFEGEAPGPTVAFRAELDALPILETGTPDYVSEVPGKGHLCGHDGHMSILYALARVVARERPAKGRMVLVFQPAEENGAGAAAMLDDPRMAELGIDWFFSLHNMPGIEHGHVALADGPVACASRGMRIRLTGKEAHASQPHEGISPREALATLMRELTALGVDAPHHDPAFAMVTVGYCRMGVEAFGIAPGEGEIWATLRALRNGVMIDVVEHAEALAARTAEEHGLGLEIDYSDVFDATENHAEAADKLREAMDLRKIQHSPKGQPMAPSEDFGRFGFLAPSAMLFLGAGEDWPALHNPDYDFPDTLIPVGAGIFLQTLRNLTGQVA